MSVALFISGYKGYQLLLNMPSFAGIGLVCSYPQRGTLCGSFELTKEVCRTRSIPFAEKKDIEFDRDLADVDLILLAGWQFLFERIDDRFVVFHDSLLPKLRGYNPTVTALIAGETTLGVTAFMPDEGVDTGSILGQEAFDIEYPLTIADAYSRLGRAYGALAARIIRDKAMGALQPRPQDHRRASYSLWRDEADYRIDWTASASQVRRFIDAVGWPYLGAATRYDGHNIRVERAEEIDDLDFPIREAGKLWSVDPRRFSAQVVCGTGMLRIVSASTMDGAAVEFRYVRRRLGW